MSKTPELPERIRRHYAGRRLYIPKGWRNTNQRDRLIRRKHYKNVARGMGRMASMKKLATDFGLSEKRIQYIVYEGVKET